jgi:esterase/lipase superfamily enzyme
MTTLDLASLLDQLEAALQQGKLNEARTLVTRIQQGIVLEHEQLHGLERRLRALLAQLDALAEPEATPPFDREPESFDLEGILRGERSLDIERPTASSRDEGSVYPVWFGTNRKPASNPAQGFTGERHDRTSYGRVDVWVPKAHRFGETGNGFWTRLKRFDFRDDRLRVQTVASLEAEAFWGELQSQTGQARADGDPPDALVFLHGYNVGFEEAAIRAAQLGVDLKVPGATAFFSWPSRGTLAGYPVDEASIEASEAAITRFLVDFTEFSGAGRVHLIAHSMGNRGLLRALQRIAGNAATQGKVRFGQIFLAAPDVDRDLFLELAHLYPGHSERTTLYASNADLAVHASTHLHDAPRAGYFRPYTVAAGIDTLAVPDFDIDLLGHSYFAQAEALLYDIAELLHHGTPPAKRQRCHAVEQDGLSFWEVGR